MASATNKSTNPPTPVEKQPLKLVLFGMPDSGKTSLLGALYQAAQIQDHILKKKLKDPAQKLAQLRQQVYESGTKETKDEVVAYPLLFESKQGTNASALVIDSDGRIANEFLTQKTPLQKKKPSSQLAKEVFDADALLLTIDASASHDQMDSDFRQFTRFLNDLQSQRTEGREVGDWPVFLVLTKCDRLANQVIPRTEWEDRIEAKKKEVINRFEDFLWSEEEETTPIFGNIDLHVAATSIRRPELSETAVHPEEPVGVAELYHDCFQAASEYRERKVRANRLLFWFVTGTIGLVSLALIAAGIFFFIGPTTAKQSQLELRIESYQIREGITPAQRLASAYIEPRLFELDELLADPELPQLPPEKQEFLRSRKEELEAYKKLRDELDATPLPSRARSLQELKRIEDTLTNRVVIPEAYRSEWQITDVSLKKNRQLKEIGVLRESVAELRNYFQRLKSRATELLFSAELTGEWDQATRSLTDEEQRPPFQSSDQLKGITYDFDETISVQREWSRTRDRLQRLRHMAEVFGVIGDPNQAVALIPTVNSNIDELLRLNRDRLQQLKKLYPEYPTWRMDEIPDPARPTIEARLNLSIKQSTSEGHLLILNFLRQIGNTEESVANIQKISEWLQSNQARDWREFHQFLHRFHDPNGDDPILATITFLKKSEFAIELKSLRLRIPDDLRDLGLQPQGKIIIRHTSNGKTSSLSFRQEGIGVRDNRGKTNYLYLLEEKSDSKISYLPGDALSVELRVQEGMKQRQLSWTRCRSQLYQFERLLREPRLHDFDKDQATGDLASGVGIDVLDGALPTVPSLLPTIRFDK